MAAFLATLSRLGETPLGPAAPQSRAIRWCPLLPGIAQAAGAWGPVLWFSFGPGPTPWSCAQDAAALGLEPTFTLLWPLEGPDNLPAPLRFALGCRHIALVVVDGRGIEHFIAAQLRHAAVVRPGYPPGAGPQKILVLTAA